MQGRTILHPNFVVDPQNCHYTPENQTKNYIDTNLTGKIKAEFFLK